MSGNNNDCLNLCNILDENTITKLQTDVSTAEIIDMMKIFTYAFFSKMLADSVINVVSWIGKTIHIGINIWFSFVEWILFIVCLCVVCVMIYIIYLGDGWKRYPSTYNTTCNVSGLLDSLANPFNMSGNKEPKHIQSLGILFRGEMDMNKELQKLSDSFIKENVSTLTESITSDVLNKNESDDK
jgi:hypothetical protein